MTRAFVPAPGSYDCTILAENAFGGSDPANVPPFAAGYVPSRPDAVRLEVR